MWRVAAANVFFVSDRFEMRRIHALPVPAQVVELVPGRDRAASEIERQAVRVSLHSGDGQNAVAVAQTAEPQPASRRLLDALPESLLPRCSMDSETWHR
jgi:hypothetical protein